MRSGSASSTPNGPISVRRSETQCPPSRVCDRADVRTRTRRAGRAARCRRRSARASSSRTCIVRTGISTATPRRWSAYARSPSIFTADAAGMGRSTAPRSPSRAASSSSTESGSCSSIRSPFEVAGRGSRRQVDLGLVALVQADEAALEPRRRTGEEQEEPGRERIERPRVAGARPGLPAGRGDDGRTRSGLQACRRG